MIKRRIFKNRHETRKQFFMRSFWICFGEYIVGAFVGCCIALALWSAI